MSPFKITPAYEIDLEPWVLLVPEYNLLLKRDRGSEGDYRGDKKKLAKKQLAYIFFCVDFSSPIRELEDDERLAQALRYVGLTVEDIDDKVQEALAHYDWMQNETAPSLKTLNSIRKGRTKLNSYFEDVDFEETDKLGRAKYTAKEYIENITRMKQMDEAIREYEKQVYAELKQNTGIRGKGTLGGKEGQRRNGKVWTEGGPPQGDIDSPKLQTQEV